MNVVTVHGFIDDSKYVIVIGIKRKGGRKMTEFQSAGLKLKYGKIMLGEA